MPLLANILFHLVQKGWWINYTNPPYRQHIWTATNVEGLIILGIVGLVGSFTSHRAWVVIRHYIQPAVQLPDPSDRLVSLSSLEAMQDLYVRSRYLYVEFRVIWNEPVTFRERLNHSIQFIRTGSTHPNSHSIVPLRFGLWAALCLSGSVILGILIPYLLGEGLQGAAIVSGTRAILGFHATLSIGKMNVNQNMLTRARVDWDQCFRRRGEWKHSNYCEDLRNDLPPLEQREIPIVDPAIADETYQFLTKFGDKNSNATQLSHYTTLRDIGYNAKADQKALYHELTYTPVSLEPFVYRLNGTWQLEVPGLVSPEWNAHDPVLHMTQSMILNTSNSFRLSELANKARSDHCKTVASKEPPLGRTAAATWFQGEIDDTLPAIEVRPEMQLTSLNLDRLWAVKGSDLMRGRWGRRLETFLITFKLSSRYVTTGPPTAVSNDPIFAAHEHPGGGIAQDREVSALGCVEVFRLCQRTHTKERDCSHIQIPAIDHMTKHTDSFIDIYYPDIQSVWFASHYQPIYEGLHDRLLAFYVNSGESPARWQDDMEERFILSMLRTRHASQIAAEEDIISQNWGGTRHMLIFEEPLLYHNNEFTNINIFGYVAVFMAYIYIMAGSYWPLIFLPVVLTLNTFSRGLETTGQAVWGIMRSVSIIITSMNKIVHVLRIGITVEAFRHSRRSCTTTDISLSGPLGRSSSAQDDDPDNPLAGRPVS